MPQMTETHFPFVILVNYNLAGDTLACVDSLLAAGLPADRLITVDNASTDGSAARLEAALPRGSVLLRSAENRGYGDGCNQGIRHALDKGAEWILLLNNDTLLAADFFPPLMKAAQGGGARLLGPLILYDDDPQRIWFLADYRVLGSLITSNPFKDKPIPPNLPALIPSDFLNGCAMLLSREVFERVGMFHPSFFMYGEEVDFCLRAGRAGFRMAAVPAARMRHKVSRSSAGGSPLMARLRLRNQIRIYRMYGAWWAKPVYFLFSFGQVFKEGMRRVPGRVKGFVEGWISALENGPIDNPERPDRILRSR